MPRVPDSDAPCLTRGPDLEGCAELCGDPQLGRWGDLLARVEVRLTSSRSRSWVLWAPCQARGIGIGGLDLGVAR